MNIFKKKIVLLCLLGVCLIGCIGVAYGYFSSTIFNKNVNGNVVTTGSMRIEFDNGNLIGVTEKMYPGDYATKEFTVKNIGNVEAYYTIYLNEVVNTFHTKSDLVYELITEDGQSLGQTTCPSTTTAALSNIAIAVGDTHHYTLKITFKETGVNQNDNLGKMFSARLEIEEEKPLEPTQVFAYWYYGTETKTVGNDKYMAGSTYAFPNYNECMYGQEDLANENIDAKCSLVSGEKYVSEYYSGVYESKNECLANGYENNTCEVVVSKGQTYTSYGLNLVKDWFRDEQDCLDAKDELPDGGECVLASNPYLSKAYYDWKKYNTLSQCQEDLASRTYLKEGQCELIDGKYIVTGVGNEDIYIDENKCEAAIYDVTNMDCVSTSAVYVLVENGAYPVTVDEELCQLGINRGSGFEACVSLGTQVAESDIYTLRGVDWIYNTPEECEENGIICNYRETQYYTLIDYDHKYDSQAQCEASNTYQAIDGLGGNPTCYSDIEYSEVDENTTNLLFSNDTIEYSTYPIMEGMNITNEIGWKGDGEPFYQDFDIDKITFVNKIVPTSTAKWFHDVKFNKIENIANLKTDLVTDMSYMFAGDSGSATELDLRTFNTANVTDMSHMFDSDNLNFKILELSSFTTTNQTDVTDFIDGYACYDVDIRLGSGWQANRDFVDVCEMEEETPANYVSQMQIGDYVDIGTNYYPCGGWVSNPITSKDNYKTMFTGSTQEVCVDEDWRVLYTEGNMVYLIFAHDFGAGDINNDLQQKLGISYSRWTSQVNAQYLSKELKNRNNFRYLLPEYMRDKAYMVGGAPADIIEKSWNSYNSTKNIKYLKYNYYDNSLNEPLDYSNNFRNDQSADLFLSMYGPTLFLSSEPVAPLVSGNNTYEYMYGMSYNYQDDNYYWGRIYLSGEYVKLRPMVAIYSSRAGFTKDNDGIWRTTDTTLNG